MTPMTAAIDTMITMTLMCAGLFVGYAGGYWERKKIEKIERYNAKIEARHDRKYLKQ